MSAFVGDLDTRLVNDDKAGLFKLLAPLSFQSDLLGRTIMSSLTITELKP